MKIQLRHFTLILFSIVGLALNASAQLCTGSLGDPVVNITFGQGTNPGQPLPASVTNYGYVSTSCPADGFYNIGNSSLGCFSNSWHSVTEDHTVGDVEGYMMIINANFSPGEFYVDTVRGLCAGTTYEFASWILNILKSASCNSAGIKPNVTFLIETLTGQNLLTYQTGDIASTTEAEWKQYGAFFTTLPGTTSVVIRMRNNAPGGCGNDLLLDDITFRPCGPKATAGINGVSTPKNICIGDNSIIELSADVSPTNSNTLYQWQISTNNGTSWTDIPGANAKTYTRPAGAPTVAGFLYRLAVGQGSNISISSCRVVSNVMVINVQPKPVPAASNNGPKCEGELLSLLANDGQFFSWTGPNNYKSNIQAAVLNPLNINQAGKYYVTVTSSFGCVNTDSTIVVVKQKVTVNAGSDVTICKGNSIQLKGGTGLTYEWRPVTGLSNSNIADPLASPTDTTMYILTVGNGVCKASDTVMVNVVGLPTANAGPDMKIFQGQSVKLLGETGQGVTTSWTPTVFINNPQILQPVVTPPNDITYTLKVVSNFGCGTATDDVFVRVFKSIKVPNAFSPNGDNINDTWMIEALETYPEAELSVFNRYGQLVYTANGSAPPWTGQHNGKVLPTGVYYYIIDVKNGTNKLSGSLLILR